MAEVIVIRTYGGSNNLTLEPVTLDTPAPDEVQIRQTAIGTVAAEIAHRVADFNSMTNTPTRRRRT